MPTPAERKALLFLAGIIVLGASVRIVRAARRDGAPDESSRQALARQLSAIDSVHKKDSGSARGRSTSQTRTTRRQDSRRNNRREMASSATDALSRSDAPVPVIPVDLDVATVAEIETLPRIGPVLAQRIVEDRSAHGPFGSLDGFERVRGVGHALALAVRDRVTFSGTARPSNAVVDHRLRSRPPSSQPHRRERKK